MLYADYKTIFEYTKNQCIKMKLKVPPELYEDKRNYVTQRGLICFARGPVIENAHNTSDNYQFSYNKITIYPTDESQVMVFEQIENYSSYNLVQWIENFHWTKMNLNVQIDFIPPIPKSVNLNLSEENLMNAVYGYVQLFVTLYFYVTYVYRTSIYFKRNFN